MASIAAGDLVDGKYRIISTIGEGGWGIVFEAENVRTFKRVALKILRTSSNVTKDILARFEREAQAAGRIGSEHIVEVFDLGSLPDGTHYMVMELLTGKELSRRLELGTLDAVTVAKLMLQLLDGLKAAHEAGILHRDLKPENLFLVPTRSGEEFVKILDFGISKFSDGPTGSATMTGAVLGSPCYMAPEQARGLKQVDARTDLYAVGTLMYESLTGAVPFTGDNFNDLMFKIVLQPRPDPRILRPELDADMAAIVMKAMAIDPKDRFQTAEELSVALQDWLASRGIPSVRPPELKRAHSKNTPRPNRDSRNTPDPRQQTPEPGRISDRHQQVTARMAQAGTPQWHDKTIPADSLGGTPLVSSSSEAGALRPGRERRSKTVVGVFGIALTLLVLAGGVFLVRRPHAPSPTNSVAMEPPPPPATAPSAAPGAPPTPSAVSLVDPAPPPPSVEVPSAPPPSASVAVRPGVATIPPRVAGQTPGSKPSTAAAASSAAVPTAPSASVAVTPPPAASQPVNPVEGREIRTGL